MWFESKNKRTTHKFNCFAFKLLLMDNCVYLFPKSVLAPIIDVTALSSGWNYLGYMSWFCFKQKILTHLEQGTIFPNKIKITRITQHIMEIKFLTWWTDELQDAVTSLLGAHLCSHPESRGGWEVKQTWHFPSKKAAKLLNFNLVL